MKIKKMFAALLSAAMVVTMLPGTVIAANEETAVDSESVVADTTAAAEEDDSTVYLDGELTGSDGVYSVTVTFDKDAQIPEGSAVSVKALSGSDEAYQEAKEQVGPEEEEQFAALDISILDADGNEIEPASAVQVEIEVSGLEGVSEDTAVTVSHINESTGTPVVEAVADTADATDGVVSFTDEATVKAAFTVDSFSTFTITWNNNTYTSTGDTGVDVTDLDEDVIGQTTYASDSSTGTSATVTTSKTAVLNDDGTYDLTLSITGEQGTIENPAKVDVLLVVDKSGSMAYDLNRNSGSSRERMKAVVNAVKSLTDALEGNDAVDVQYNLITFSSIKYTDSDRDTGWTTNAAAVNSAVSYFTETESGWWGSTQFSHDLAGGTNYEYAFYKANNALNSSSVRSDAQQIVIFLTDGIPTHCGTTSGNESQDNNNRNYTNTDAATALLSSMDADAFYAIGIGPSFTSTTSQDSPTNGRTNLNRIVRAAQTAGMTSQLYTTTSSSELEEIFKTIAGSMTFIAASDVTITDELSEYADLVLDADDNAQFTITVSRTALTDSEGNTTQTAQTWTSGTGETTLVFQNAAGNYINVEATYSEENKTITLDFPDNYELEEGYTYSISTVITTSAAAVAAGEDRYNGTGDADTGTHAEEDGFYSNGTAEVTYTANDKKDSAEFPKPVIQLQFFYVYHSCDEGTITKVYIKDSEKMNEDGTFDITSLVCKNCLYGGYYSDYAGKGNYKDDGVETSDGITYTGNDYVNGEKITWDGTKVCKENGLSMTPVAGETYYLKEVPSNYLLPVTYLVYDENNDNQINHLYLVTAVDDANYQLVGFDMTLNKMLTDAEGNTIASTSADVSTGSLVGRVTEEKDGENEAETAERTLTAAKVFADNQVKDGLLAFINRDDYIVANANYVEAPYFVTLDGVKVTGAKKLKVYLRDTTYQNWSTPGITRLTQTGTISFTPFTTTGSDD